jgi:23S rRNA (uridine2552-2'-O)-methyltransferase
MSRFVVKDSFYRKAKQDGFRARSAYKLEEIQKKFALIRTGDNVLDLGCAPGSFLQVISRIVGTGGIVAGIDVLPVPPIPQKNVRTTQADIRHIDAREFLDGLAIENFNVITCDVAPNLSGIREVDDRNVGELYEAVRRLVVETLKPGGHFLLKSFFSQDLKETLGDLKGLFKTVSLYKPTASRSVSSEIYVVCLHRRS